MPERDSYKSVSAKNDSVYRTTADITREKEKSLKRLKKDELLMSPD